MVFIALVKSHSKWQKSCLLSYVEHNSLLISPAFIFIPYLKTLLLTCIIKVGPLSVTTAWVCLFCDFFDFFWTQSAQLKQWKLSWAFILQGLNDALLSSTTRWCYVVSYSRVWPLFEHRLLLYTDQQNVLCFSANKWSFSMQKCHHSLVRWRSYCSDCTRLRFCRVCWCFSSLKTELTVSVFSLCAQWSA